MTQDHAHRFCRWSVFLTVTLFAPTLVPAAADDTCRVQLGRGWAQGAGKGTMIVKNNGKACGSALYTVPEANIAVDAIRVDAAPKNGTLKIDIPKFLYTPAGGFVGRDRFELTAEGPDRPQLHRVTLKGEVIVQVDR